VLSTAELLHRTRLPCTARRLLSHDFIIPATLSASAYHHPFGLRPSPPVSPAHQAYQRAIQRVVRQRKQTDGEAHVLDIGCGSGILSLLAAKAGARRRGVAAAVLPPVGGGCGRRLPIGWSLMGAPRSPGPL
jgi:SAM-dependent methyltransferase